MISIRSIDRRKLVAISIGVMLIALLSTGVIAGSNPHFEPAWQQDTHQNTVNDIETVSSYSFVASEDGNVSRISNSDGSVTWKTDTLISGAATSVASDGNTVWVGDENGGLTKIAASDGSISYSYGALLDGKITAAVEQNGIVYIAAGNKVAAWDDSEESIAWEKNHSGSSMITVHDLAMKSDRLFSVANDDKIIEWDVSDGTQLDTSDPTEIGSIKSVEFVGDSLFVVTLSGEIAEYSASDLTQTWIVDHSENWNDIRYDGGRLFAVGPEKILVSDSSNGDEIDSKSVSSESKSVDSIDGRIVYGVGSDVKAEDFFINNHPEIDDSSASPSGGDTIQNTPVELSIDVSDPDFETSQGDEVTVTFYDASDDSVIGTDTLTSNGTATTSWDSTVLGENSWYAVAEDDYGGQDTSDTFWFETPHELEIRNESDPDSLVTDAEVTVQFFEDGEEAEVVERSTTDGVISLEGLEDRQFAVQVVADGYVTRQAIIDSITEQQTAYVLPEDEDAVSVRFRLDDQTGQFSEESARIFVQRPITRDGETIYRTVTADDFGPGGFTAVLERDQRYRIKLRDGGNERTLEPYSASADETITLEVDRLVFNFDTSDDVSWNFNVDENEDEPNLIKFSYLDEAELTDSITVLIHERGNESNVLLKDTFSAGPYGELSISEEYDGNVTDWQVTWEAERDGETLSGSRFAGERGFLDTAMPDWLQHVIGVFAILVIAGLGSQVNAPTVGVATVFTGSVMWYIGFLPAVISGGVIAFGLAIPALYLISGAGSGRGI